MPLFKKTLEYTQIPKTAFDDILSRYPSTVPQNLRELDTLRYDTIPTTVASREKKGAYLTKDEVVKLVEWKLKHGTFRPKLLSLVSSNLAKDIEKTTREAFSDISGDDDPGMFTHCDAPLNALAPIALKGLTKLKGIGPATASLLLSVNDPTTNPFFSDELFRWMMWDAPGSPGGWKRPIKYNAKEYEQLLRHVNKLSNRLDVRAVDMEKVAWVLGKNNIDVAQDVAKVLDYFKTQEGSQDGGGDAVEEAKESVSAKGGRKGVKRKAAEAEVSAEGVRRSTRRKTT